MHLQLFLEQQDKQMVPNLIGTKELETPIHRTNSTYICAYIYENKFHASKLRLGGVSPIYWVKEGKHAKETTRSKYACSRLSRTKTKPKQNAKRKGYQIDKSSLGRYH